MTFIPPDWVAAARERGRSVGLVLMRRPSSLQTGESRGDVTAPDGHKRKPECGLSLFSIKLV